MKSGKNIEKARRNRWKVKKTSKKLGEMSEKWKRIEKELETSKNLELVGKIGENWKRIGETDATVETDRENRQKCERVGKVGEIGKKR